MDTNLIKKNIKNHINEETQYLKSIEEYSNEIIKLVDSIIDFSTEKYKEGEDFYGMDYLSQHLAGYEVELDGSSVSMMNLINDLIENSFCIINNSDF
jgi:hypothetical protein